MYHSITLRHVLGLHEIHHAVHHGSPLDLCERQGQQHQREATPCRKDKLSTNKTASRCGDDLCAQRRASKLHKLLRALQTPAAETRGKADAFSASPRTLHRNEDTNITSNTTAQKAQFLNGICTPSAAALQRLLLLTHTCTTPHHVGHLENRRGLCENHRHTDST